MRLVASLFAGAAAIAAFAGAASASQLVYTPVNPQFGGSPLNGTFLLSTAQAQGKGKAASGSAANTPDLSGLDQAIQNLSTGLGNLNVSPNVGVGAPIIILNPVGGIPATP